MRRIISGTAYDTETAEMVKEVTGNPDIGQDGALRLYQTRNGAYFLWEAYVTRSYEIRHDIVTLSDERAQAWLEEYANELVEQYFGQMPEGGTAERRLTLRLPNGLAKRLEEIATSKAMPLNRYLNRCLERCAKEDGKPATIA